jgi:hypothetical protein
VTCCASTIGDPPPGTGMGSADHENARAPGLVGRRPHHPSTSSRDRHLRLIPRAADGVLGVRCRPDQGFGLLRIAHGPAFGAHDAHIGLANEVEGRAD